MEKRIQNMNAENRTAHIWNIYANTENTNINAKIAEGLRYARITGKKLTAKSVKGHKYALIKGQNINARSAVIRLK